MRTLQLLAASALAVVAIRGGPARAQADVPFSKPVTVFIQETADGQGVTFSKAVTLYVLNAADETGVPFSKAVTVMVTDGSEEAISPFSKSVTVFVPEDPETGNTSFSKAVTVYVPTLPYEDPWSKAVTIQVPPYAVSEVADALRIAAGLDAATPLAVDRLDTVNLPPLSRIVTLEDAVKVLELAMHTP